MAVAGCGSAERQPAAETAPADEIVARIEPAPPADPNAPLPPGACLEATAGYGLALVVDGGASPALCERIARFLPARAGRAAWPLPASHHEDESTPTLECAVARDGVRVEVLTWPVEESGPRDPYDICAEMVRGGWELQPLFPLGEEVGGADAESGTCFVATRRYEVALAGETERGQALCEELATRHLPAPIAHRAIPVANVEALGDTVCEASRSGERVRIVSLPGDRRAVDLPAVCDSLEGAGWKVVRWG
jgi:hypothetical protein